MALNIILPELSAGMEDAVVAKWLVAEGDRVTKGQLLAEIETDKATMELEAADAGIVGKLAVAAGARSNVGEVIAVLLGEGETLQATEQASAAPVAPASDQVAQPASRPVSEQTPSNEMRRQRISPLARRLARAAGLTLDGVAGSGPGGRVVRLDIERLMAGQAPETAKAASSTPSAPTRPGPAAAATSSDDASLKLFAEGSYELLPHDGMRRTIASRLTESTQTVPSYTVSMECEIDAMLKLRSEVNASAPVKKTEKGEVATFKLSVNDFVIKAMALALRDVPRANVSWTSLARVLHKHVDVGVAVSIVDGLITPIIRKAEEKSLSVISNEVKDLAKRARDKKLKPEEYQGGTTSVSNLGMFGVSSFTSIINLPQASIVSIGAGVEKPVVKDGKIEIGTVMTATFAFDHRVIDGALGAELASAFKRYIENPMGILV